MMNRILIAALTGVLVSLAGAATPSDRPLEVVDANGAKVGRYLGAGRYSGMEVTVDGKTYLVWPSTNMTTMDFSQNGPYYDTADCSGKPYALVQFPYGARLAMNSGQVRLWPAGQKTSLPNIVALLAATGACLPTEIPPGNFAPLELPIDITDRYARPFHVQ